MRSTPVRAGDLVKLAEIPDAFSPQFRGTGYPGNGRGILSTRDDYRQNAVECLRLARSTPNASDRAILLDMAHTWRKIGGARCGDELSC